LSDLHPSLGHLGSDDTRATELLVRLGLTKNQRSVYEILLHEGPSTIPDLAKKSGIHRANAYRIVKHLKDFGLIELILGDVTKVKSVVLDEAVDILIARQEEQLDRIRSYTSRASVQDQEQMADRPLASTGQQQIFARLLVGRHVYRQQERLIGQSRKEILQVTSSDGFLLTRNLGLIDAMGDKAKKSGIEVKILTEIREVPISVRSEIPKSLEIRNHSNTLTMLRYFIADRKHLIVKMAPPPKYADQSVALWSNSADLIRALCNEFEKLWSESSSI